jgi:hypothetical protein
MISKEFCNILNDRLEAVLRGQYDIAGGKPDKVPKFDKNFGSK